MSILLTLAICLSQFDYLIERKMIAEINCLDKGECLEDCLDGDGESSDSDKDQKEVKSYHIQGNAFTPFRNRHAHRASAAGALYYTLEKVRSNPFPEAIFQPPKVV